MEEELAFFHGEYDYPTAFLGDVKIYFNHSKTEDDARNDWNRRKSRINYDNLYIIMYDRNGLTNEDFETLSDIVCKNKVVLSTSENQQFSFVKKLVPHNERVNGPQCLDKDIFGIRTFEKQWDYVDWLNRGAEQTPRIENTAVIYSLGYMCIFFINEITSLYRWRCFDLPENIAQSF